MQRTKTFKLGNTIYNISIDRLVLGRDSITFEEIFDEDPEVEIEKITKEFVDFLRPELSVRDVQYFIQAFKTHIDRFNNSTGRRVGYSPKDKEW